VRQFTPDFIRRYSTDYPSGSTDSKPGDFIRIRIAENHLPYLKAFKARAVGTGPAAICRLWNMGMAWIAQVVCYMDHRHVNNLSIRQLFMLRIHKWF
jgi:hypothetical protein